MSYTPAQIQPTLYQGDTFAYLFTFEENGSAFDLSVLNDISFRFFNEKETIFEHTVSGGELTISGASSNELSGTASAETMDIGKRSYYLEVTFIFSDGSEITYLAGRAKVIGAKDGASTSAKEFHVSIDTANETVEVEQLTGLTALAIQAKEDAQAAQAAAEQAEGDTQDIADQALIDITSAKDSALSEISTAETDAITAIEQAETDGITAVNNARDQGVGAVESARDSAISTINGLVAQAEDARDAAQAAETNAASSASAAATSESNAAGSATTAETQADRAETQADRAESEANNAETAYQNTASEVRDKRVEDDAFAFNQHVIATTSLDALPPAVSLLPTRPNLENGALNFSRSTVGSAFEPDGSLKEYNTNEVRYNYNRDTGIFEGRYIEGQATRLNTKFSSPTTNEDVAVNNVEHVISFYGGGSVTLSGAHSDTINGTDSVTRTTATFTPSAGTLTISPIGTIEFLQLEEGSFATSPIAGDGQQQTRDPDIANVTDLDAINFNPDEGTFVFRHGDNSAEDFAPLLEISDGTSNEAYYLRKDGSNNNIEVVVRDAGVTSGEITGGSFSGNTTAFSYSTNSVKLFQDGSSIGSKSISIPSGLSQVSIGKSALFGGRYLDGFAEYAYYYPRQLSDSLHQTLTA